MALGSHIPLGAIGSSSVLPVVVPANCCPEHDGNEINACAVRECLSSCQIAMSHIAVFKLHPPVRHSCEASDGVACHLDVSVSPFVAVAGNAQRSYVRFLLECTA
ncbi:hypothetical protein BD310DRAFT_662781 [Dichomitus squalens]|uniref:Uncharacterized protein n=1 Tax=Dichomitus squalens TaxID=114155 RepID=A0A4Q9Q6A2_9APHY|nr:hypothetical protein BD310DRAFT_662781 [Dichomitus squalens]